MSYIRSKVVDQVESDADTDGFEHGFRLDPINLEDREGLDADLDFEILNFILGLVAQVEQLREGEALVIWKEIF